MRELRDALRVRLVLLARGSEASAEHAPDEIRDFGRPTAERPISLSVAEEEHSLFSAPRPTMAPALDEPPSHPARADHAHHEIQRPAATRLAPGRAG